MNPLCSDVFWIFKKKKDYFHLPSKFNLTTSKSGAATYVIKYTDLTNYAETQEHKGKIYSLRSMLHWC